jgi:hypothetical protein
MKIIDNSNTVFFFILSASLTIGCAGSYKKATPEDKAPYQEIKTIDGTKDDLFLRTKRWMAETFRSSKAVIEFEDKENGQIIGNTRLPIKGGLGTTFYFDMTIIIGIRDGKIRLTAKNFRESVPGISDFKTDNAYQWQELKRKIGEMFDGLILFIQTDRKNENW